jgi:hypothetical protein
LVSINPSSWPLLLLGALLIGAAGGMITNAYEALVSRTSTDQTSVQGVNLFMGGTGGLIAAGLAVLCGLSSRLWLYAAPFAVTAGIWAYFKKFPDNRG